jgi:UTP--glucose-1-phosphate uridylyltransferase
MRVRKAVIPAAGFGTRFLPVTKTVPKEMLPIVDKPVIQYIVEEAVRSGIEEVILVTSSNKKALEDFFDTNFELEANLEATGKTELLAKVRYATDMANITYVRQKHPLGNGHAVLAAKHAVGDEPFAVLWGDDIMLGDPPVTKQLIDVAVRYDGPVVGVRQVAPDAIEKYGILAVEAVEGKVSRALSVVEKPRRADAPSNLAQIGGFVLTPDIFEILENSTEGTGGEIWLADALNVLMQRRRVYAFQFEGTRYDAGNKLDFLRATIELALEDPEVGAGLRVYLSGLDLAASRRAQRA